MKMKTTGLRHGIFNYLKEQAIGCHSLPHHSHDPAGHSMNLLGLPVYQKAQKPKPSKQPTTAQRKRWDKVAALGCMAKVGDSRCGQPAAIHHAETGAGGRKDHDKVIPLCHFHHQGEQGLHTLSRPVWQPIYGYEMDLLQDVENSI